jgi:HK97 family phage portal protein
MKKLHEIERVQHWAYNLLLRARILPQIAVGTTTTMGAMPKENLEAYTRAYAVMAPIFVGVNAIMSAAASVPMRWYEVPRGGEEKDKQLLPYDHPLHNLFRFANYFDTGYDIIESMYGYLLLTGNAYFLLEPSKAKQPTELWPMRGDRVTVVPTKNPDPKQFILRYDYRNDFGEAIPFLPEDVIHLKFFNPYDSFNGQGFVSAARNAIAFTLDAMKFNSGRMKSPFPDVVLKDATAGNLQPPQPEIDRIKANWNEAFGGITKTGTKVAIVGALEPMIMKGLTPQDVQWILGLKDARQEMYQTLGIPPVIANTPEEKYATALVQKRIFWEGAVIPKHTKIACTWTQWAQPRYGDRIMAAHDYSEVAALQEDQVKKAQTWIVLTGRPIASLNEGRAAFHMLPVEGGDGVAISSIFSIQAGTENEQKPRIAVDGTTRKRRYIESEERTAKWNKWVTALLPWEKKWKAGWIHSIDALEARLKTIPLRSHRQDEWEIIDAGIDEELELSELRALCHKLATEIIDGQGQAAMAALGIGSDFNVSNPNVAAWITKKTMTFSTEVWGTTKATLEAAVKAAVSDPSLTVTEIAKAIEQAIGTAMDVRRSDAMAVARTESVSAANAGNQLAWEQSGVVDGREWLTARDELVRESHAAMDGETALMNEPYSNDLMFPGDPSGEPGEIINCRCTELAQVSEEKMLAVLATRIEKAVYPGREGSKRCELKEKLLSVR